MRVLIQIRMKTNNLAIFYLLMLNMGICYAREIPVWKTTTGDNENQVRLSLAAVESAWSIKNFNTVRSECGKVLAAPELPY